MAIPTISTISPENGQPFGGFQILIAGTNFRVPNQLPGESEWEQSVQVTIGSYVVPNSQTRVRSTTLVEVQAPKSEELPSSYPLLLDVNLINIDATGTPIAGETVTVTDAFTYQAFDLEDETQTNPTITESLWLLLQDYLERNLGIPVFQVSHVDYKISDMPVTPNPSTDPGMYFTGPAKVKDPFSEVCVRALEYTANGRLRNARARNHVYQMVVVATHKRMLDRLSEFMNQLMFSIPNFIVTLNGSEVVVETFLDMGETNQGLVDSLSSLQQFSGTITMKGVPEISDIIYNLYEVTSVELRHE